MSLPTVASVVSSGLASYPTVYYNAVAKKTLQSNLWMYPACNLNVMQEKSGVAMQIYDHTKMGANVAAITEGTPGASGQALTQNIATINLANYGDFVSISNKVQRTSISRDLENAAKLLAYRGALSVDNVISTAVDTASNSDSNTRIEVADGAYMTSAISRKAAWQLRSVDVQQRDNGLYFGVIHSLSAYDLVNDAAAGSLTDLQKYTESLAATNPALVGIKGSHIGNVGGVDWFESNAVPTETNWQSSSHTAYHAYVFGDGAFEAASLGKTDLGQKNFEVTTKVYPTGSNSLDMVGTIAAGCAYNFFFGVTKRTGSTAGFRRIRVESSIG